MGDKQLKVGEKVHLAPFDGIGPPEVVEYRGQTGGLAVVIGADRMQFMVAAERLQARVAELEAENASPRTLADGALTATEAML